MPPLTTIPPGGAAAAPVAPRPVPHWWLVFLVLSLVLLARQPGDLPRPQFNAEEGTLYFQRAFNEGFLSTLLGSASGYYHLLLTLTAGLALLVPLELAPLAFKVVAFAVQMLPVGYLLAGGVAGFVTAPALRVAAAALYVVAPNSAEVYLNVNNSQWPLTLAACLILLSPARSGRLRNALDLGVLTLFALSGPYSLICVPLAAWSWWRLPASERSGPRAAGAAIVLGGALIQAGFLVATGRLGAGPDGFAGVTPPELLRILSLHGTLNSLFGIQFMYRHLAAFPLWAHVAAAAALPLLALAACRMRNAALLVLCGLAATSIAVMFVFPLSDPKLFLAPEFAPRYYFFTTLAILFTLLAMAERGGWWRQIALPVLAIAVAVGVREDFRVPPSPDTHWKDQVAVFRTLPAGSRFFAPIYPQPTEWGVTLVKKRGEAKAGLLERFARADRPVTALLSAQVTQIEGMPGRWVALSGVAADPAAGRPPGAVFLEVDGQVFPAVTDPAPRDPTFDLDDPAAVVQSGFFRLIPARHIGPGIHRVAVWALDHTRTLLLERGPELEFSIPVRTEAKGASGPAPG